MFFNDTKDSVKVKSKRVLLQLNDNMFAGTTTGWMTSEMFVWFG
jgi:hypothetical protein